MWQRSGPWQEQLRESLWQRFVNLWPSSVLDRVFVGFMIIEGGRFAIELLHELQAIIAWPVSVIVMVVRFIAAWWS